MLNFPNKWRETVDPFSLDYTNFKLTEILGFPHAGNDVFFAKGIYNEKSVEVFIKVNRQKGADVKNEVLTLNKLQNKPFSHLLPKIIDYDENLTFRVSLALYGERLSNILNENSGLVSLDYMQKYGKMLATLHQVKGDFEPVKDRRFFHIPNCEVLKKEGFEKLYDYLVANQPKTQNLCFCHGDFHYANVLWQNGEISAILDFELAGIGIKEFDIAWALILRPGQKFLTTQAEFDAFLNGYAQIGNYEINKVLYYMAQIYCYFYFFNENNKTYTNYIKNWLDKNIYKTYE